jgi:glycosyltransferase involved in cell wall biosynthesis
LGNAIHQEAVKAVRPSPNRILFANPVAFLTGAEAAMLDLMVHLDRSLYQPFLLVAAPGLLTVRCKENDIPVELLKTIPPPGGRARDTYQSLLHNAVRIARIIKKDQINLVHSNSPRMAYHSGLAARLAGVLHITHVRDYSSSPFFSPIKARFLDLLCDGMIAVSRATQHAITCQRPVHGSKIRVIYDGLVEARRYSEEEKLALRSEFDMAGRAPLLAVVGSISQLKGQAVAIRSLPAVLAQYPQACLLLVGSATDAAGRDHLLELKRLVASLQLEEHVMFAGLRSDVPRIMASVDLLVHPPVMPDAFPHVLLEASAQQALIVASDIGGINEIVIDNETGVLVTPNQPDALSNAVVGLLADQAKAARLRQAAGERVRKEFTIQQYVSQVQNLYAELLFEGDRRERM